MKKILLFIAMSLTLNNFSINPSVESKKQIKLCISDKDTNEKLPGVTIILNGEKKYTDLNGEIILSLKKNQEALVEYISYQKKNIIITDTTKNILISKL